MKTTFRDYKVIYQFTKTKFSFQNQVTVNSINESLARDKAMDAIAEVYGTKMLKYFKIVSVS